MSATPSPGDYPPPEHFLRDLAISSELTGEHEAAADLEVAPAVLDRHGAVAIGALLTLVDVCCARAALAAVAPNWVATADLSLSIGEPVTSGHVTARARVARAGSKLVNLDIDLGAAGAAAATFVQIPGSASRVVFAPPVIGERTSLTREGPALATPLTERIGLRTTDGAVELDSSEYVSNSFRTINGGVLGFLVAAAAEAATGWTAVDATLRYVGQTKVGPARATARIVRTADAHAVCDVTVVDVGAGGTTLVRAFVTTAPL